MKTLKELCISPTPWKCEDGGLWSFLVYDGLPRNERHCVCSGNRENLASGKLIAAAPELYTALTTLIAFVQNPLTSIEDMSSAIDMAQKAIEKVGGGK